MQLREADGEAAIFTEELQYSQGRRLEKKRLLERRRVYDSVENGMDMWRNKKGNSNSEGIRDGN